MPRFKEFLVWWNDSFGKNGTLTLMGHTFPDPIHAYAFLKTLEGENQSIVMKAIGLPHE